MALWTLSLHASRTTCPGRGSSDGYLGLIIAPIGAGGQHAHATIHVAGLVDPDRICLGTRHRWLCVNAEVGRASCRERVCQYVSISVVAGSLKQKNMSNKLR